MATKKRKKKVIKRNTARRKRVYKKSVIEQLATNRKHSNYEYEIRKRVITKKKKGKRTYKITKYVKIPVHKFKPNKYYRIYLIHKRTKDKRLLGFGKFYNIPFVSTLTGKQHVGYAFKATKAKAPKGWIASSKLYTLFQREIERAAKDAEPKADVRASLMPIRKWYHPKYEIFSDYKVKLSDKPDVIGVSVLLQFNYGHQNWMNKRVVFVDQRDEFRGKKMTWKELTDHKDDIADVITSSIDLNFVSVINHQAEISVVAINGFIPTKFVPKGHVSPFGKSQRSIIQ